MERLTRKVLFEKSFHAIYSLEYGKNNNLWKRKDGSVFALLKDGSKCEATSHQKFVLRIVDQYFENEKS